MEKILMPIMETGSGHKAPAVAVKEAIEALHPGRFQIDIVDLAREAGALTEDARLKNGWDFVLRHPFVGRAGYKVLDLLRLYPDPYVNLFLTDFKRKGIEYIERYSPDIIFSTHFWCSAISAMARDRCAMPTKVIAYVTDPFNGWIWWATRSVDAVVASSVEARDMLLQRGMPAEKIHLFPFPIVDRFLRIESTRKQLQERYRLDPSMKTILCSAGGQGIGRSAFYARKLVERDYPLNIILVCGKNEKLQAEMERFAAERTSKSKLVPLGYVTNMNELHLVCDLTMGKAGASALFETLLMRKPVIFTDWVSYNEKPNIDFCTKNSVGWHARSMRELLSIIDLIESTDILEEYAANIGKLGLRSGAVDIARFVVESVEGTPIDISASPSYP